MNSPSDPTPEVTAPGVPDDLTLMAYADGQLEAAAALAVEQALARNPALAARVQAHQALARRVAAAFGPALDEPVPARLQSLLQATPPPASSSAKAAAVADFAAARADREERAARSARAAAAAEPTDAAAKTPAWGDGWARWGGMAASLVLGLLLGLGAPQWGGGGGGAGRGDGGGDVAGDGFAISGTRLLATGAVAQALQTQPSGAAGAVAVTLSFVDREGRYCRAFSTAGQGGLACREGGRWAMTAWVAQTPPAATAPGAAPTPMRQANTALPAAVLQEVDARIAGSALDASAEAAALQRGWAR